MSSITLRIFALSQVFKRSEFASFHWRASQSGRHIWSPGTLHKLSCTAFRAHRLNINTPTACSEALRMKMYFLHLFCPHYCCKLICHLLPKDTWTVPRSGSRANLTSRPLWVPEFPSCSSLMCAFMCHSIIVPGKCWREWKLSWITSRKLKVWLLHLPCVDNYSLQRVVRYV